MPNACRRSFSFRRLFVILGTILVALGLELTKANASGSVTLAWDANPEPDIAGFRVYYGTSSAEYSHVIDVGNVTTAEVPGLATATTYYFAVSAYNTADLESELSSEVSFTSWSGAFRTAAYTGTLVLADSSAGRGYLKLVTTSHGGVSGRLVWEGVSYAWRGAFDADGRLTTTISRGSGESELQLVIRMSGQNDDLSGSLTGEGFASSVLAERARTEDASELPLAGRYTVVLPPDESRIDQPQGYGTATLVVSRTGSVKLVGTLADGLKFSTSGLITETNEVPIHALLYKRRGYLAGEISFRTESGVSDADAILRWEKPAQVGASRFPDGFAIDQPLIASKYECTPGGSVVTGLADTNGSARLTFAAADLPDGSVEELEITMSGSSNSAFTSGVRRGVVRFRSGSGTFGGHFLSSDGSTRKFGGVLFQKGLRSGYGLFLGQTQSGRVELEPGS